MNIAIYGAGAAGSLFAAYLSSAGYNVALADPDAEKTGAIAEKGITVLSSEGKEIIRSFPAAVSDSASADENPLFRGCDYYIFCVKAYSTAKAAESASALSGPASIGVTFQNGAGNIEAIEPFFGRKNVAAGTTTEGASLAGPGIVIHGGSGMTRIGMVSGTGRKAALMPLIDALGKAGFRASYEEEPQKVIWEKLAVNCCINPLTALTGCRNRAVAENYYLASLASLAAEEAVMAAKASGIILDPAALAETVFQVARATGENISSMLQDIQAGRKTETDYISGFLASAGEAIVLDIKVSKSLNILVKALGYKDAGGRG